MHWESGWRTSRERSTRIEHVPASGADAAFSQCMSCLEVFERFVNGAGIEIRVPAIMVSRSVEMRYILDLF
jgi:hypothetical protein